MTDNWITVLKQAAEFCLRMETSSLTIELETEGFLLSATLAQFQNTELVSFDTIADCDPGRHNVVVSRLFALDQQVRKRLEIFQRRETNS